MTLLYRPSYDGTHWRITRVRDGVDERTLGARFGNPGECLDALDRLNVAHELERVPVAEEEAYWRRVAIGGEWDDDAV